MSEIEALLKRIGQNGHEVWIAGPQTKEAIGILEATLNVHLPPSYRQFLLCYGAVSIYDSYVAGIIGNQPLNTEGGVYATTTCFRQERGVPEHLIVIQPDEEALYCFDTRRTDAAGEFPIICYELYSGADNKIADNFLQFIVRWFLEDWTEEKA